MRKLNFVFESHSHCTYWVRFLEHSFYLFIFSCTEESDCHEIVINFTDKYNNAMGTETLALPWADRDRDSM